jgi:hypothetical protein
MLREKQPIIIQDRVAQFQELKRLWFSYNFTKEFEIQQEGDLVWIKNKFKYVALQSQDDVEVLIAPASEHLSKDGIMPETATLIAIQLKANQVVIMPFHMHYAISTEKGKLSVIGVHDLVTKLLP